MRCGSVLAEKLIQGLFPVLLLDVCCTDGFFNGAHKPFHFSIRLWPIRSDFAMFETKATGELFKFRAVTRRTIITFEYNRNTLAGKYVIQLRDDNFCARSSDNFYFGNGPTNSTATSCHGASVSGVIIKGSGCRRVPVVAAWHGRRVLNFCPTILSMEENQTFSRSSIFVLTMPWWPTCARSMAWLCSE